MADTQAMHLLRFREYDVCQKTTLVRGSDLASGSRPLQARCESFNGPRGPSACQTTPNSEGYADWVLFSDGDELPMFTADGDEPSLYKDILYKGLESKSDIVVVSVRNCFTRLTERSADLDANSPEELISTPVRVARSSSCQPGGTRTKMFARPARIDIIGVHVTRTEDFETVVQDLDAEMWLMHLSNHVEESDFTEPGETIL